MNNKYLNPERCAACGGACCKSMGCHIAPSDLAIHGVGLIAEATVRKLLEGGWVSLDYWVGDVTPFESLDRVYYLRMRHRAAPVCDPSWGGECVALGPTGCAFTFEQRPKGGQMLKPVDDGECVQEYTKEMCATEWRPYHKILHKLWEEFANDLQGA